MDGERWARFTFLYRQGEGFIGRREWALSSVPPVAILIVMTLAWLAIAPHEPRDLAREGLFDLRTFLAFVTLVPFTLAAFLCAIALYFVGAKRFADRGKPPALAGVAPFALLLAGAAHWYQPRSEGMTPGWTPWVVDAFAAAAMIWTIAELGFGESRRPTTGGPA